MAQGPPPIEASQRAHPHVRIRCLRGGLARRSIKESDQKPRVETADGSRVLSGRGRYGRHGPIGLRISKRTNAYRMNER